MTKFQAVFKEFSQAIKRLDDSLKQKKTEFMRDSAIKRFELAFDLSWKTIKAFLEEKGVSCTSPTGCFKEAYRQSLISFDEIWVELTKTRNKTVHTYDEELAEEVYSKLPEALSVFQKLAKGIKKIQQEEKAST